jgi:ABC transport system ATP-binding/permease protein
MNYLSVEQLTKSLGQRVLFENLQFGLSKGDKAALVASNGKGKTTLLRIIAGKDSPDSGSVVFRKDIRVGYLDQNPEINAEDTVLDYVLKGDLPILKVVRDHIAVRNRLQTHPEDEKALDTLSEVISQMDNLHAWDLETQVIRTLSRFRITDLEQKVGSLSGGQQKRVALCGLMIQDPDLILLDEPTNHLDVEMIGWLEDWLSQGNKTFLVVTHDRYFLNQICTRILELEDKTLYDHPGDYGDYLEGKSARESANQSQADKDQNLFKRELEWARRMPKARTTKSKSRMDAFSELKARVRNTKPSEALMLSMKMQRLGNMILEFDHTFKAYGDKIILKDFSYTFKKGERTGIAGPNGTGKSTFLNLITQQTSEDSGSIKRGETLKIGYYTQNGIQPDDSKRVIEWVQDIAEYVEMEDGSKLTALQLLRRFLFTEDMPYAYIHKLSGGEKRRLALLGLLIQSPNFLILDEPTNDLDLATMSVLEEFLMQFKGVLLIVSHDRYFMSKLTDSLLVFEGNGKITPFNGSYVEFMDIRKQEATENQSKPIAKAAEPEPLPKSAEPTVKGVKLSYKEQRELEALNLRIPELESSKLKLAEALQAAGSDFARVQDISKQIDALQSELDDISLRWLELEEKRS